MIRPPSRLKNEGTTVLDVLRNVRSVNATTLSWHTPLNYQDTIVAKGSIKVHFYAPKECCMRPLHSLHRPSNRAHHTFRRYQRLRGGIIGFNEHRDDRQFNLAKNRSNICLKSIAQSYRSVWTRLRSTPNSPRHNSRTLFTIRSSPQTYTCGAAPLFISSSRSNAGT